MSVDPGPTADASMGDLMTQLSAQTSRLVRDEMRFAQKELQTSLRHAGKGAGLISGAGVLAFLGAATLIAAAVSALALVLPLWAAALIVGVVLLAMAGIGVLISRREVEQVTPAVPETVESVKKDIDEVRGAAHVRS